MPKNITLFLNIGNGASYFLRQAFQHIDLAIEDDITDQLFHEKPESLDVETEHISSVFKDGEIKNAVDLLQSDILKLIEDSKDPVMKAQGEAKEEAAQMRNFYSKNAFQEQTDTIEAVARLFRLRNRTAHYTPENAESLKVTINELFNMWGHTGKLLAYFHSLEQFTNDDFEGMLRKHITSFEEKWVKKL